MTMVFGIDVTIFDILRPGLQSLQGLDKKIQWKFFLSRIEWRVLGHNIIEKILIAMQLVVNLNYFFLEFEWMPFDKNFEMKPKQNINRREFIGTAAAASVAFTILPRRQIPGERKSFSRKTCK